MGCWEREFRGSTIVYFTEFFMFGEMEKVIFPTYFVKFCEKQVNCRAHKAFQTDV